MSMVGHASTQRGEQATSTERDKVSTGDPSAARETSGATKRNTTPATSPSRSGGVAETDQAQLDAACEAARESRLAPERARYIEECVARKQKPDRAACEKFYADYGAQSGARAPLYYDLPACRRAFEARKDPR
jgi:hypothetical protein